MVSEYDAIIVGARVAGTAAAILLGRQGRKVLLLDRAAFPSDTISTHIVMPGGARVLDRMGALDELKRLGAFEYSGLRIRTPHYDMCGQSRDSSATARSGICLTRVAMDAAMVEMARSLDNVTVAEGFRVTDVLTGGDAVTGVRGAGAQGAREFRAPLTIGADGMRSVVAQSASQKIPGAFVRDDVPCARAYYYAYYDGADLDVLGDTVLAENDAAAPGDFHIACGCERGRVVVGVGFDPAGLDRFRRELPASFERRVRDSEVCARLLSAARLSSKVLSVPKLLNTLRYPVCNGALLLGDAGLHVDPILGQGHAFALMTADIMARFSPQWFQSSNGNVLSEESMRSFAAARNADLGMHYQRAVEVSRSLESEAQPIQGLIANEQWAIDEMASFGGMLLGPGEFPSPRLQEFLAQRMAPAGQSPN
jgi:2-polyprenyl-6-methoxyphenol hydroxylase-like FAD-dependent oxidoreductase